MSDVTRANGPEVIELGPLEIRYLHEGGAVARMGCFELRVPPGGHAPPAHAHVANEELLVVLEGCLRITVGAVTRDLSAGEAVSTPPGMVHGFSNPFSAVARALVINTPDIGPQYFREMAALIKRRGVPDRNETADTMRRFGLVLAAPPSSASASTDGGQSEVKMSKGSSPTTNGERESR